MAVAFNPSIFRRYDIRGLAEDELQSPFVEALGKAFGTVVRRAGGRCAAIGRDCRDSGPRLVEAFSRGVRSTGVDVLNVGSGPTPLVYFALHHCAVDGGVAITGSHNPPAWNGFKLYLKTQSIHSEAIQTLRQLIETEDFESGEGKMMTVDLTGAYHAWLRADITPPKTPLKVVVDAGNGTGGPAAVALYEALGVEVVPLYCEPDSTFPNHHPDPTVEANLEDLKATVIETGADLGLAFDGDADRVGAVDHLGRVVWGDQLLLFFGRALLEKEPGARIVGEVKCSRVLYDGLREAGGRPEMWKVGHSLIKARMKETGAKLAGEMSGHIFFADRFFGFDDAVYAGARLIELIGRGKTRLADLVDTLPKTEVTPELRVACSDDEKFGVVNRAAAHFRTQYPVIEVDGLRIDFPTGWGLIRPSNTQPVLVMRFEADDAARLSTYRQEVEDWLKANAPEVNFSADTHT